MDPVALREYINRELVERDHANPDQKTVDIACRPKPRTNVEKKKKMMKPNRLYRAKLCHQQFALAKLRNSTKNSTRHSLRARHQKSKRLTNHGWRTWAAESSLLMH